MTQRYRLASDIGGTFTDTVLVAGEDSVLATAKTPTTPDQPALGALEGALRVLEASGVAMQDVSGMIHGTTLATNALIERRGAKVCTITTAGFRDILEIAYERRYSQYAINIEKPDLLVSRDRALTIGGRLDAEGHERTPLDVSAVPSLVKRIRETGAGAVAVCLLHAYANPAHEQRLRDLLLAEMPELVISLSHEVSPEAREFDRLCTTIANASVQPLMARYLADFRTRFEEQGLVCPILMMTAGGGMTTLDTAARFPVRLVESGPAGGAILAARIARDVGATEVLSFDMGGTTAKLCLIDNFRPQTARKFEISRAARFVKGSGMPVRIPVVEMIEIGAGGGSIASVDRLGRLQVGPRSAGANPGPAAFGKGGTKPTVTDADVVMGLIDPERFAEARLAINSDAASAALDQHVGAALGTDAGKAAFAISEHVDENMANAGRMHAVESGKDLGARTMIAFGGNGPLHATRVARRARIGRILIPRDPGVGSAVGFLFAPVSFELVRTRYTTLKSPDIASVNALFEEMLEQATGIVRAGAPKAELGQRRTAFMRYCGQGHEIETEIPDRPLQSSDIPVLQSAFEAEYARQFSRIVPGMEIEILNWGLTLSSPESARTGTAPLHKTSQPRPTDTRRITCDVTGAPCDAAVYLRGDLEAGAHFAGPALVVEAQTTTLVSADFSAQIDGSGNIWLTRLPKTQQGALQ